MKKIALTLCCMLIFFEVSQATNYYISNVSGSDTNNGLSKSTPFKTCKKVPTSLNSGDSILFKGGETADGSPLYLGSSGDSLKHIVVSSYDNVLSSGETANACLGLDGRIIINGGSFITIRDLIITGSWDLFAKNGAQQYGIQIDYNSNIKKGDIAIVGCEIAGFYVGIYGYYSIIPTTYLYNNINIMYCNIHRNGKAGIDISSIPTATDNHIYAYKNLVLYKNNIYNNFGTNNQQSHTGDGAVFGSFSHGVMSNNMIYHNGWGNANYGAGPAGIWCWDSDSITIEYNEACDNGTMNGRGDGDGFDLDGGVSNSVMQYNYSHDNWAAGYLLWNLGGMRTNTRNNVVRYNISENDNIGYPIASYNVTTFGGLTVAAGCTDTKIYNNTISSKNGPCVKASGTTGFEYYNNIFYSQAPAGQKLVDDTSTSIYKNNIFYSKNSTTTTTPTNNLSTNPLLTNPVANYTLGTMNTMSLNNYKLQSGSPAKDAGIDLTASPYKWNVGKYDYNGLSIPAGTGYDIGACEAR